jgi:2-dehydro-3-deoxyphosphogalactonate aldolase
MPRGAAAVALGLVCLPGVATPSEAFAALDAGATGSSCFRPR